MELMNRDEKAVFAPIAARTIAAEMATMAATGLGGESPGLGSGD